MAKRLKPETLKSMRGQTPLFLQLVEDFGLESLETVRRWMRANKPNGPLTSEAALRIVSKALDLPAELLTEEIELEDRRRIK